MFLSTDSSCTSIYFYQTLIIHFWLTAISNFVLKLILIKFSVLAFFMSWLNLLGLLLVNCSTVYILVQSIVSRSLKQEVMRLLYQQKARGRVGFLCRTQSSWQEDALFYPSLNFDFLLQEVHPQSPFAGPLTSAPSASHKGCSSVDLQCHRGETSNQRAAVRSDHRGKM